MNTRIKSLSQLIQKVSEIEVASDSLLFFRGEPEDYKSTALIPNIYRDGYIQNEEIIYREMQRFNEHEFASDKTAFDKLSRMQHYNAPTRLLDISEDLLSAVYFAIGERKIEKEDKKKDNSLIYIFEIEKSKIKYYDSDAVSVISNLAKIPLSNDNHKSKKKLCCDIDGVGRKKFNKRESAKFLRHEIREEKPQFEAIIKPKHIKSIQCVRPKLTSDRIRSQKGVFLLFGLNPQNIEEPIKLLDKNSTLIPSTSKITHPIKKIHKIEISYDAIEKMQKELKKIGITKPFIYPELDKVSEYLKEEYKYAKK